ncbi:MAG: hypothetical protein ACKOPS_05965, partial [Cyanobium sp.]
QPGPPQAERTAQTAGGHAPAAEFELPEAGIVTLNENRYFCFSLGYLPQFPLVQALRAELRIDFTVHTPLLDPVSVRVTPLLAEFMPLDTQVVEHQAVRRRNDTTFSARVSCSSTA